MINDFTFLYANEEKVKDAFGNYNPEMLLKNSKRVFGGREKVFFEYARDESAPCFGSCKEEEPPEEPPEEDSGSGSGSWSGSWNGNSDEVLLITREDKSYSGFTVVPARFDEEIHTSRYETEYVHEYCRPLLIKDYSTFETKRYFSIDVSYILNISRAFTNYNFQNFDGEGLKILKAWIFVMTYGYKVNDTILIKSSKNEYGNDVRNRVFVRNYYDSRSNMNQISGAPYALSNDSEWALSGDDYSRVAVLDYTMNMLGKGRPLVYDGSIMPDTINKTRDYGELVPKYLTDIFEMQKIVNTNSLY